MAQELADVESRMPSASGCPPRFSGDLAMKQTPTGRAFLTAALLMTVLTSAVHAAPYVENFDNTSLNTAYFPGSPISGSDFHVVQGLAYDFAKGGSTDRYVDLLINSTYGQGPTARIESTTLFDLDAGVRYKLSFDFSPTSGASGNGPFNWNLTASIGGFTTTVDGSSGFGSSLDWHSVDLYFTPNTDQLMVPIIFAVASTFTDYANAPIDNVSFSAAPVPEPESWAMLLAGLGLVGFVARRRQA
jgi:hypothetical protein